MEKVLSHQERINGKLFLLAHGKQGIPVRFVTQNHAPQGAVLLLI